MQWMPVAGPLNTDLHSANPVRQWVASLHFVTATVTTVGYGEPYLFLPALFAPEVDPIQHLGFRPTASF